MHTMEKRCIYYSTDEIMEISRDLIKANENMGDQGILSKQNYLLKYDKFKLFKDQCPPIWKAILKKQVNESNIHIFLTMIREKKKIDTNQKTLKESSSTLGKIIANSYDFDERVFDKKYWESKNI